MGGRSSSKVRVAKRPKGALTLKQQRFVAEFAKDLNATQAAKRAGYSEKSAGAIGAEDLTKPVIWAAIQERHQQAITDAVMSAQEVLEELTGRSHMVNATTPLVSQMVSSSQEFVEAGH